MYIEKDRKRETSQRVKKGSFAAARRTHDGHNPIRFSKTSNSIKQQLPPLCSKTCSWFNCYIFPHHHHTFTTIYVMLSYLSTSSLKPLLCYKCLQCALYLAIYILWTISMFYLFMGWDGMGWDGREVRI